MIDQKRRKALQISAATGAALLAGLLKPSEVFAAEWNKAAFEATKLDATFGALGAPASPEVSADITINAPDIAENGAVVPVGVTSKLPGTQQIAILVERNPSLLTAMFMIADGTDPSVNTRVKIGSSSEVFGVVKAGDKWYMAKKEVKVTLGGCGG